MGQNGTGVLGVHQRLVAGDMLPWLQAFWSTHPSHYRERAISSSLTEGTCGTDMHPVWGVKR